MDDSAVCLEDLCGVPKPGTEWMLRDVTGIGHRELAAMANDGYVELLNRQRTLGNKETRETTQLNAWRTKPSLWESIARSGNVRIEAYKAFASRPEADLYVVDVFKSESDVAQGVDRVAAKHGLDIQLVGLTRNAPRDYTSRLALLDDVLQDGSEHPLRAVPIGNLVAITGFPEYTVPERWFREEAGNAEWAIFEPTADMVVRAIEEMLDEDTKQPRR